MKKQIFSAILVCQLLAPSVGLASADEITSKEENTETSVQTKLTQDGGKTEEPLNDNSEKCKISGNTDLEKSWGYGYMPKTFKIDGTDESKKPLNDEGSQEILMSPSTNDHGKAHVGIKNKSRQTGAWRLTAKTDFDEKLGEKADGITFSSANTLITDIYNYQRPVQEQSDDQISGNGIELVSDGELTAFSEDALTNRSDGTNLELNKEEKEIFKGIDGIVHNGFYNLQLRNCKVVIPDTRRIQNDDFNCQITWNLAKAPGAEEEK